jgi:hypothetical protein
VHLQFKQGVALNVDDDGLHLRTEITIPPPREVLRRGVRWVKSCYRAVYYSFFPYGPAVLLVSVTVCLAGV